MSPKKVATLVLCVLATTAVAGYPCMEAGAQTVDFKLVQTSPHQMVVGSDIEYEVWAKVTDTTNSSGLAFFRADVLATDPGADPSPIIAPAAATFVSPFDTLDWAMGRSTGTLIGDDLIQAAAGQDTMDALGTTSSITENVGHGAYVHLFDGVVQTADDGSFGPTSQVPVYVSFDLDELGANVLDAPLDPAEPDEGWTVNTASTTGQIDVSGISGGVVTGDGFETVLTPEPATLALVGLGGLATLLGRRKARR